MNPLETVRYGLKMLWEGVNWLWGWSLFAEAYFWQFFGNRVGDDSNAQIWMIARSFRTAIAGANRLTGGMFEEAPK